MSAITEIVPSSTPAPARPGNRAALAFALSLGVHVLFFGLLGWSLRGERRPLVIPVELVFGAMAPIAGIPATATPEADATMGPPATLAEPVDDPAEPPPAERPARPRFAATTPRIDKPSFVSAPRIRDALIAPLRPLGPADAASRPADATLELAVHDWLRRHQRYPRAARRAGIEGTAHVRFVIDRGGALRETELVASSGHAVLDRAALELLQRAAPYPALPRRVTSGEVELTLPVEYRLSADATRG
ncbi:MAG TPA: energy transducer TonB [Candidatus Saccharimonadia bacterium]|nr:energy transducer TonB [Candidatus Saccharimonadia bacterium]